MTLSEAEANLNTIYKTLKRERAMREKVIKDPAKQAAGLAEIDNALAALLRIKDELKQLLGVPEGTLQGALEQATLLDIPKRTTYP